jgi:hypothetical protein
VDGTLAPTPIAATMVARAGRGGPSPEPGPHGRTVAVQPPLGIGRYEGTDMFLGRRRQSHRLAAIAPSRATAPQYVCGAGTSRLPLHMEMKSAHTPGRRHREHKKVDKIPLRGIFCLLTTGDLPRNCCLRMTVTEGSPRTFGPTHSPTPWPAESSSGPSGRDRIVHSLPYSDGRRRCRA